LRPEGRGRRDESELVVILFQISLDFGAHSSTKKIDDGRAMLSAISSCLQSDFIFFVTFVSFVTLWLSSLAPKARKSHPVISSRHSTIMLAPKQEWHRPPPLPRLSLYGQQKPEPDLYRIPDARAGRAIIVDSLHCPVIMLAFLSKRQRSRRGRDLTTEDTNERKRKDEIVKHLALSVLFLRSFVLSLLILLLSLFLFGKTGAVNVRNSSGHI